MEQVSSPVYVGTWQQVHTATLCEHKWRLTSIECNGPTLLVFEKCCNCVATRVRIKNTVSGSEHC
jgi:hypothetical protein